MKNFNFLKIPALFFLLLAPYWGFAQYTSIPDSNFEQALIDLGIDSGAIDGQVLDANIANITELRIPAKNIEDLTGIQGFLKLEILSVGIINNNPIVRNKLTTLDISKNLYLKELDCTSNDLITLDVSKNLNLIYLNIDNNKVSNIDISNNIGLKTFYCANNSIASVDITKNTSLLYFSCERNQLTSLDISKNLELINLFCSYNKLTSLDVTKNSKLKMLFCSFNQLSGIDLNANVVLESLSVDVNQITNLDFSKNASLLVLTCNSNKLTFLDISKNTKLFHLDFGGNQITNIDTSKNLSLTYLAVGANPITDLDVTKNTALQSLSFNYSKIANIDVSKNTALTSIHSQNTMLTTLDVSKNPNLITLFTENNQLTSLNLKNGNNAKFYNLSFLNNSNLTCIQVDNENYSNSNWSAYKDNSANFSSNCNKPAAVAPPTITATGDQLYCPLSSIKIVESILISNDPSEPSTDAVYIQISSGYSSGFDQLTLSNPAAHPTITTSWDATAGKLKLSSPTGASVLYSEFQDAIEDVVFSNSSATASGTRTFSITIGQANYLPSTGHYYLFQPNIGVTWTNARDLAAASSYYGLQGYLATILSADEAKLIGEQASGTGWIGGSDAETEGVWKWVTGPEAGNVMTYTFWNTGEPNNQGDEDYAHITQPGVGIRGSWNDLSNTGSLTPGDDYQPKGYVVEYGGMPGETPLNIAASTKITIPVATPAPNPSAACDSGSFTFTATANAGTISWYSSATGGAPLTTGNTFTTPTLTSTTNYYVDAGCESSRKMVTATVNITPMTPVAAQSTYTNCGPGSVTIQATSDIGFINWYENASGGTSLHIGNSFTTPQISSNKTYYAEASNNGCINPTRVPVNIEIYTPPAVTDETVILCESQSKTIDAGISGMDYLWSNGATTQTTDVSTPGIYTVIVKDPSQGNCSSTKKVTVNEHLKPVISRIDVEGTRAIIYTTKAEDYFEYSVDGTNFYDSNIFYNVPGGLQTAYVQEKNNCGADEKQFVVLVFPAFFTPNNDTYNDVWEVTGMENYPQAQVTIFDRYGKFIAELTNSKMSWDGMLNKTPLPASDYWYALKIDDTKPILRGHFSLKR